MHCNSTHAYSFLFDQLEDDITYKTCTQTLS